METSTRIRAKCRLIRRVLTARGNDSLLVELTPPLDGDIYQSARTEIRYVVLAPRFVGESFDPGHRWPVIVYVLEPLGDEPEQTSQALPGEFVIAAWGEAYPTEEAAIAAKRDMD